MMIIMRNSIMAICLLVLAAGCCSVKAPQCENKSMPDGWYGCSKCHSIVVSRDGHVDEVITNMAEGADKCVHNWEKTEAPDIDPLQVNEIPPNNQLHPYSESRGGPPQG